MNADTDTVVTGEGDDEKIYTLARSEITGWTIVGCMNMAELLKSSKEANNIYVCLLYTSYNKTYRTYRDLYESLKAMMVRK